MLQEQFASLKSELENKEARIASLESELAKMREDKSQSKPVVRPHTESQILQPTQYSKKASKYSQKWRGPSKKLKGKKPPG